MNEMRVVDQYRGGYLVRVQGLIPQEEVEKLSNPIPDITPGIFSYFLMYPDAPTVGTLVMTVGEMPAETARRGALHPERIIPGKIYMMATIDVIAASTEEADQTLARRIEELSFEHCPYSPEGVEPHKFAMRQIFDEIQNLSGGSFDPQNN